MKNFSTILFIFFTIPSFSQITVAESDLVNVGDILYEALDSVSGSNIQIGSSGANQTWDFSSLQQNEVNSIEYLDPSSTAFGFIHPTSNVCTNQDGEYQYFKKTSTGVEIVGFDDQAALNPIMILPLPLTYPMQFSTGPLLAIDESAENSFFPDSIAPFITFGDAHTVDSIRFEVIIENNFIVDGYGDVIIPMGSFAALRLSGSSTSSEDLYLYCTDTLFGTNSGWYPAPQQLFPSETETNYFVQWWSNDPAAKFTLVNIDVDEYGYNDGDISFLTNNPTSIIESNDLNISIFPNPVCDNIRISTSIKDSEYIISDLSGKILRTGIFSSSVEVDLLDIPIGLYMVKVFSDNNIVHKKIIKQ